SGNLPASSSATRPPAPPRRHQTRHRHLSLLSHPPWSRCHCCRSPPHRAHHHSRSRLTNLLTTCKHSGRKGLIFGHAQDDIPAAKLSASNQGSGDECRLRTSQGQHPLWLSVF